jgi:hypothetical protein
MTLVELDQAVRGVLGDRTYSIQMSMWRHARYHLDRSMVPEVSWELWVADSQTMHKGDSPEAVLRSLLSVARSGDIQSASDALEVMP